MPHWCTPAQHVQLAAAAAGCLAACGAGGQLEELRLSSLGTTMPLGSLAALTRLRRLHAVCDTLSFTAELSPLTDVQYMQMHGDPRFEAPARLPSSLTCLQLSDTRSDAMPEQLTLLPGLQRLSLSAGNYSAASMAPLSRLTALTHLVLDLDVGSLPTASLASLTRLRFLRTNWRPDPPARHLLDAALQALQRLTCLSLASGGIPPAVGGLPLLQCFFWQPEEDDEEEQAGQPPALPRTHSLHSLRCLGLPWRSAAASVPALAAMPALQELSQVCF
ncbi:LRR protein [Micractinium conductrix]|uniref:LRR protein n=1 Tax=Micractinium conductrix TaxID=554055 RepID=A0A2P6VCN8_9CHLO|nr:LRR protein [Micractinium conductrix]|eukprot:PSC71860.1 LRR protein [Micractinium conductrix]